MIPSTAMTDAQRKLLFSQMEKENIDKVALEDRLGFSIGDLSKQEASVLIDCIMHDGDLDEAIEKILNYRVDNRAGSSSQGSVSTEQNSEKSKFTVEPGSELAIAKIAGLPPEMANLFFMKLNGNAYIKVAGLQFMAGKKAAFSVHLSLLWRGSFHIPLIPELLRQSFINLKNLFQKIIIHGLPV